MLIVEDIVFNVVKFQWLPSTFFRVSVSNPLFVHDLGSLKWLIFMPSSELSHRYHKKVCSNNFLGPENNDRNLDNTLSLI